MKTNKKKKAFSLAELLIVSTVVLILLAGYVSIQKKMINWKNEIELKTRISNLQSLLEAYYIDRLKNYKIDSDPYNNDEMLEVLPYCENGHAFLKETDTITAGRLYICAEPQDETAPSLKRVGINYLETSELARSVLTKLSAIGAGADILNPFDPWNRPLIFLVFLPIVNGRAYCPVVDGNGAKMIIISLGPNGKLDIDPSTTPLEYLSQAITDSGQFNPNFTANGDDLIFSFSSNKIDLEKKRSTILQLQELSTLLKNKYFNDFYSIIRRPELALDPTKMNFFAQLLCSDSGTSCSFDSTLSMHDVLTTTFGFTQADTKDFFGNYLCFDPDIIRTLASYSCNSVDDECVINSIEDSEGFVGRLYSVCALEPQERAVCSLAIGDVFSQNEAITILDPSLIVSISGMY